MSLLLQARASIQPDSGWDGDRWRHLADISWSWLQQVRGIVMGRQVVQAMQVKHKHQLHSSLARPVQMPALDQFSGCQYPSDPAGSSTGQVLPT